MAGFINYQIWQRQKFDPIKDSPADDLVRKLVGSGTIATTGTISSEISVPTAPEDIDIVGVFEVYGDQPIYVHLRDNGATASAGTGTHAAVDTQPRMLLRESDGSISVTLSKGGKFAVVDAAVFS